MRNRVIRDSLVLWMFILGASFYEAEATLKTVFLEDLCHYKTSGTIDLVSVPVGILISSSAPWNTKPFDCTVTFLPKARHSVVLSIYSYFVGENNNLTIEDSDRHKIALLGSGKFEDEKKSIISEGKLVIRYQKKEFDESLTGPSNGTENGTLYSPGSHGFQFTFTQVRNGPCQTNEFQCENGKCLPEKYICTGHNHCGDNSYQRKCVIKKDPGVLKESSNNFAIVWISAITVAGTLLVVLIAIYIVVLLRSSKSKTAANASAIGNNPNNGANNVPLQLVSSNVPANQPPAEVYQAASEAGTSGELPRATLYDRVRRSLRRSAGPKVNEPVQQHGTESYQVPSMYPSLDHFPSAPEIHGADNPDFKMEE